MSGYWQGLEPDNKKRYAEKLACLDLDVSVDDPLLWDKDSYVSTVNRWPPIKMWHIVAYFLRTQSRFTPDDIEAYTAMDAHKYIHSGWLQTVYHREVSKGHILRAKVLRSQSITEKPHEAWLLADPDGKIFGGHCTCTAGLGEVCSHVSAIAFKAESRDRAFMQAACTSLPCEWNSSTKKVPPAKIIDIDFVKPKKNAAPLISRQSGAPPRPVDPTLFLQKYAKVHPSAAIFSITNPIKPVYLKLPRLLTSLHSAAHLSLDKDGLEVLAQDEFAKLQLSHEQAFLLEEATRRQTASALWRQHRKGRITASIFGDVMSTSESKPAVSLLKKIMSYGTPPSSAALQWGIENEKKATELFISRMKSLHDNFSYEGAGLVVNPRWPYLGASPDGLVECDCHGIGVLEVKCPYTKRNESACSADYLTGHTSDLICPSVLSKSHKYYYQIQGQMNICNVDYCHFVVFTCKSMHVETIERDSQLFVHKMIPKFQSYFLKIVMPELLTRKLKLNISPPVLDLQSPKGSTYTTSSVAIPPTPSQSSTPTPGQSSTPIPVQSSTPPLSQSSTPTPGQSSTPIPVQSSTPPLSQSSTPTPGQSPNPTPVQSSTQPPDQPSTASPNGLTTHRDSCCKCGKPEDGKMIQCDNSDCAIKLYHMKCLRVKKVPKGNWYCLDCRGSRSNKRRRMN